MGVRDWNFQPSPCFSLKEGSEMLSLSSLAWGLLLWYCCRIVCIYSSLSAKTDTAASRRGGPGLKYLLVTGFLERQWSWPGVVSAHQSIQGALWLCLFLWRFCWCPWWDRRRVGGHKPPWHPRTLPGKAPVGWVLPGLQISRYPALGEQESEC